MFGAIRAARAARLARREYELARLETLIANLAPREPEGCRWCKEERDE